MDNFCNVDFKKLKQDIKKDLPVFRQLLGKLEKDIKSSDESVSMTAMLLLAGIIDGGSREFNQINIVLKMANDKVLANPKPPIDLT